MNEENVLVDDFVYFIESFMSVLELSAAEILDPTGLHVIWIATGRKQSGCDAQ